MFNTFAINPRLISTKSRGRYSHYSKCQYSKTITVWCSMKKRYHMYYSCYSCIDSILTILFNIDIFLRLIFAVSLIMNKLPILLWSERSCQIVFKKSFDLFIHLLTVMILLSFLRTTTMLLLKLFIKRRWGKIASFFCTSIEYGFAR